MIKICRKEKGYTQIAILDEANKLTGCSDRNEDSENLNEIFNDKTLIVISHKPAYRLILMRLLLLKIL